MLEIRHLTKYYDEMIIDDLSFTFPSTGLYVLVGESGCGKTTLMNIIGGLDHDYQGEIFIDRMNIRAIKHYCRRHVGFIFQNFNLINWLRVKQNYLLPKFFANVIFTRAIEEHVAKLELQKLKKKKPKILSGGQKQRVALLRAMVKDVDILLCDEPTGSLDSNNAKMVFDFLKEEAKERLVIVISHDEELANQYGDGVYLMKAGKLIGPTLKKTNEAFYCRLKQQKSWLSIFQLCRLQYLANFVRNMQITGGIMLALVCIMVTFSLGDSMQKQVRQQLNSIFPTQLLSIQGKNKKMLLYHDLETLKQETNIDYVYGESQDYEFMGISKNNTYNSEQTIYISDMTKQLASDKLEKGRMVKEDNEVILTKSTAMRLDKNYEKLLNQSVFGYYYGKEKMQAVELKIVGISNEITTFDTMYISEFANLKQISKSFNVELNQIGCFVTMANLKSHDNVNDAIKQLQKKYPQYQIKMAGERIGNQINNLMKQSQNILILFSSLAIVAACFLIGEVLYLAVVEKSRDIGIYKCLGASKFQIRWLVLCESLILITIAFLMSFLCLQEIISFINEFIKTGLALHLENDFIECNYMLLVIIYLGAIVLGTISSCFPAYFASRLDPVRALKEQSY